MRKLLILTAVVAVGTLIGSGCCCKKDNGTCHEKKVCAKKAACNKKATCEKKAACQNGQEATVVVEEVVAE